MPYDPERHDRRSMRLPAYDYRQPGGYFVTVCAADRACLFGKVLKGRMHLNDRGRIAAAEWKRTAEVRDNVQLDAFVVMPNHVHGIIVIVDNDGGNDVAKRSDDGVGATGPVAPTTGVPNRPRGSKPGSLGAIIGQYKSVVTKRINRLRGVSGQAVWQRNYYEHVIRNRADLNRIRRYIAENPARWDHDRYHVTP